MANRTPRTDADAIVDAAEADVALADAALAFLRSHRIAQLPILTGALDTPVLTATAAWAHHLGMVLASPQWRPLTELSNPVHAVTLLRGQTEGHPHLRLLAAVMSLAGGTAVSFAYARPCPADPARFAIQPVYVTQPHTLARGLRDSALDAQLDHGDCLPSHGDFAAICRLNDRQPHRERPLASTGV